jgi:hypothetical protein
MKIHGPCVDVRFDLPIKAAVGVCKRAGGSRLLILHLYFEKLAYFEKSRR